MGLNTSTLTAPRLATQVVDHPVDGRFPAAGDLLSFVFGCTGSEDA